MSSALSSFASSPWKPCDLRGPFPEQISPALFESVGQALGATLPTSSRVLLAGDFRLSTVQLKEALAGGLVASGVTVLDAGQLPTPIAYFSGRFLEADAVLIVTASHNPASDNGLKLMIGQTPPTPKQLRELRSLTMAGTLRQSRGRLETVTCVAQYGEFICNRWAHLSTARRPKLILDPGNGAWSTFAPELIRRLGFDFECLACVADGNFPSRSPDCSRTANLSSLRAAVLASPDSLGIAWDGDGDRVAFVDETGVHVSTDEISILLARHLLTKDSVPETVVVDIKLSDLVRREIITAGGHAVLERSGHSFMRARLLAENAILGLDACGHYFFREIGHGDDGLFSALFLLGILAEQRSTLSQLRGTLPRMFTTPELRIPMRVISYATVVRRLQQIFPDSSVMNVDGTRLVQDSGVVLARESSTEPVVSLRIEGVDPASYKMLLAKTIDVLPEAAPLFRQQGLNDIYEPLS